LDTIEEIGATEIPIVTALNKIDLIDQEELKTKMEHLKERASNIVPISAYEIINIDTLKQEVIRFLEVFVEASFSVKINNESMAIVSELFEKTHVQNIAYEGKTVKGIFRAIPWHADRIKGRIEKLGGTFTVESKTKQ